MDKFLVNVYVPIINKSYDMFVPAQVALYEVLELIKKAVAELSEGQFISDRNTTLCRHESGEILDINKFVYELEVHNGSKLMLI